MSARRISIIVMFLLSSIVLIGASASAADSSFRIVDQPEQIVLDLISSLEKKPGSSVRIGCYGKKGAPAAAIESASGRRISVVRLAKLVQKEPLLRSYESTVALLCAALPAPDTLQLPYAALFPMSDNLPTSGLASNIADPSRNGRCDGTRCPTTRPAVAPQGQALAFDSIDDSIVGPGLPLPPGEGVTIGGFVELEPTTLGTIISAATTRGVELWSLGIQQRAGVKKYRFALRTGSQKHILRAPVSLPERGWTLVNGVYNPYTGTMQILENGIPIASRSVRGLIPSGEDAPFVIGGSASNGGTFFRGSIGLLGVIKKSLAPEQLLDIAQAFFGIGQQNPAPTPGSSPGTTPTPSPTSTATPSLSPTTSPTNPPTTPTLTATPSPTQTVTPTSTATPNPTVTPTPTQPPLSSGWTSLTPSADSRVVYVSSSMGNDSNNGLSPSTPKRTIDAGKSLMRDGFPDWLRLKAGDLFANQSFGNWTNSGRSASEPTVITSYGAGPRPIISSGSSSGISGVGGGTSRRYLAITDLHFRGREGAPTSAPNGTNFLTPVQGFLIEGCLFERYSVGVVVQGFDGRFANVSLRRNVVIDSYSVDEAHSGGAYLSGIDGLLIEENIFDQNGWIDVPEATPPTQFRHNIYVQNDCSLVTTRKNYLLRASANGLSQRSAGIAEDNVLARNSVSLLLGAVGGQAIIRRNVIMDGKDIDPNNPRGWGIDTNDMSSGTVADNLLINNPNGNSPGGILIGGGQIHNLTIERNIVRNWGAGIYISQGSTRILNLRIRNNHFQELLRTPQFIAHADPSSVGAVTQSSNNTFFRALGPNTWFTHGGNTLTLAAYKSLVNDTTSSAQQITYTDPNRSLASYHGSLGRPPTFEAFVAELRQQSKANWRPEYNAVTVANWIRAGFGMSVQ